MLVVLQSSDGYQDYVLASLDDLKKSAASLPTGLMQGDWQNFFTPSLLQVVSLQISSCIKSTDFNGRF